MDKSRFNKRLLVSILSLIVFLTSTPIPVQAQESSGTITIIKDDILSTSSKSRLDSTIITDLVESMQNKDWDTYVSMLHVDEINSMQSYFNDTSNVDGLKQINNIELLAINQVSNSLASDEWCTEEYPVLNESLEKESLQEAISTTDYAEEGSNALTALSKRSEGLLVNNDLEEITRGFELIKIKNILATDDSSISTYSFPTMGDYHYATYPTVIRVKLTTGSIVSVNFVEYMRNVLPKEWYASWNQQSLIAGALCVKMVGWYRRISPVSVSGGYDVTTTTQNYVAGSAATTTDNAIAAVYEMGMANSSSQIFFPEYAAGVSGQAGPQSGGQLKQWGSQYLAQQGYKYDYILNYYYKGSVYSSGNLIFFNIYG